MVITFTYFRYVTRQRNETRTRRARRTIYQCCTGYMQEDDECPLGMVYIFRKIKQAFRSFYVQCVSQETRIPAWYIPRIFEYYEFPAFIKLIYRKWDQLKK